MSETDFHSLNGTLDQVWRILQRGVVERSAPARHVTLATSGLDDIAQARIVVLRAANRDLAQLEIYTDGASHKLAELARNPKASVLVWDQQALFQMRMSVDVTVTSGTDLAWKNMPNAARYNYGGTPTPSTPIDSPQDYAKEINRARFITLNCAVNAIDTVYLGLDLHRRAKFMRIDGFRGGWVAP